MDPIQNPFSPGAGSPPPELVGRANIIESARILLGRVKARRSEKSLLLTGLRGVGKTVLLNEIKRLADSSGYRTVYVEARESTSLAELLIPPLRTLLFDLDRIKGAGDKAKRGLAVLKGFMNGVKLSVGGVEVGLEVDSEQGVADSGNIANDLPPLFAAVADAALERQTAVALLIDEVQYFDQAELGALIMAMHKMQQDQLPFVLVGAGLPVLPGLAGDSKSYAERLFAFPDVGPLSAPDATQALRDPTIAVGVDWEPEALARIVEITHGYPYFLQEWGYQAWNRTATSPITLQEVDDATATVIGRLDANFFRVRFDRLTPSEKRYLRAMAEHGAGPYRSSDVAQTLDLKPSSLAPTRDKLIRKGMIYSPAYGELAFTVPVFDEFMRRAMPDLGSVE